MRPVSPTPASPSISGLRGRIVVVLGYGNQGRAHALNLRDSGVTTLVAVRPGGTGERTAREEGFETLAPPDACAKADLVILAVPDEHHESVYRESIAHALPHGATIGILHGMSVHYGFLQPAAHFGVIMVAPKGPGTTLRARYVEGHGIPCLLAVHQENPAGNARLIARAWAEAIGCGRAAILDSDCATEARSDLFGEQAVLCGGVLLLVRAAWETLVRNGIPPEIAWIECGQELKQVVDLLYRRGPEGMMRAISTTAEFGAHVALERMDDAHLRAHLDALLDDITNGRFAHRLRPDDADDANSAWIRNARAALSRHPMTEASRAVRRWFPETD